MGEGDLDSADFAGDGVHDIRRDAVGIQRHAEIKICERCVVRNIFPVHRPAEVVTEVEGHIHILPSDALKDLCWNLGFIAHVDGDLVAFFGVLNLASNVLPASAALGGWAFRCWFRIRRWRWGWVWLRRWFWLRFWCVFFPLSGVGDGGRSLSCRFPAVKGVAVAGWSFAWYSWIVGVGNVIRLFVIAVIGDNFIDGLGALRIQVDQRWPGIVCAEGALAPGFAKQMRDFARLELFGGSGSIIFCVGTKIIAVCDAAIIVLTHNATDIAAAAVGDGDGTDIVAVCNSAAAVVLSDDAADIDVVVVVVAGDGDVTGVIAVCNAAVVLIDNTTHRHRRCCCR